MRLSVRILGLLAVPLLLVRPPCHAQATAGFPPAPLADRVRLAEAIRVANGLRAGLWPGWSATPMPILLVTDSVEYLVGHPSPSADFAALGQDNVLGAPVWARARVFPPTFLATFPAVGGIATVVVGSAERTGKSSAAWVITLLHEHFHQWQYAEPDYYCGLAALNLSRGDTTGMWALEFPFPYDSVPVQRAARALGTALAGALVTANPNPDPGLRAVRAARDSLLGLLAPDDRRYLEFQLWQEGVARWVEYAAAGAAARLGPPLPAFQALPDYQPYSAELARAEAALRVELAGLDLGRDRRTVFYPLGAALALLADRQGPSWKRRYAREKFQLSDIISPAP